MILSDRTLKHALHDRDIQIVPPIDQATQLDCCGIYGTLGKEFRVQQVNPDAAYIDPRNAEDMGDRWVLIDASDDDPFILEPDAFVLAATKERLTIPHDMVAFMDGRTSLARIGVIVHGTAGQFKPGWSGVPTLELKNIGLMPVALYPGMLICSFTFHQLTSNVDMPYFNKPNPKYMHQREPLPSRLNRDPGAKTITADGGKSSRRKA